MLNPIYLVSRLLVFKWAYDKHHPDPRRAEYVHQTTDDDRLYHKILVVVGVLVLLAVGFVACGVHYINHAPRYTKDGHPMYNQYK